MKNYYLLVTLLLFSGMVSAQHKNLLQKAGNTLQKSGIGTTPMSQSTKPVSANPEIRLLPERKGDQLQNKAVVYSTDFSSMAGWTTSGSYGFIWSQDFDGPNGEFSDNTVETIASPTVGNGFAIFDADAYQTTLGGAYVDVQGSLVSPVIDMTGKTNSSMTFYQIYRWCCNSSFIPMLEFSSDGFTSEVLSYDISITGDAVNATTNTEQYTFILNNVLTQLANPANFQFRFTWDGVTNSASHYHWQIDDLEIYDNPNYDLKLQDVYWGNGGANNFATVPTYQVPFYQVAPVTFSGKVSNYGAMTQPDAMFNATATAFSTSSPATSIDPAMYSYLETGAITLPSTQTTHTVSFNASSSQVDAVPADNIYPDISINVNASVLASDNNVVDNTISYSGLAYEVGNVFHIYGAASLNSAQVQVSAIANAGAIIRAKLYEVDPTATDLTTPPIFITQTNTYTIAAGDLGADVNIAFPTPPVLTAGKSYILTISTNGDGGATDDFVCRTGGLAQPLASVFYDPANATWYYNINTAMVRMVMSPLVTISSSDADNTVCGGQTVTLTSSAASGNVWSNGATSQSITVSSTGTYSVTANGNTASVTVTVVSVPTPIITAGGSTTFCAGNGVSLTASASSGLLWSNGATAQTIFVTTGGNYTVTQTISGCSATSAPMTITVNSLPATPTISASGPTTFCTGGSVILTSSAATGNTWSTGEITQSITVTTSGTYTVTNTQNGCSASSTGTVVTVNAIPATPTITASGATTFCSGGSVTLTSSAGVGNTWSSGQLTQSITVTTSGNYTVTNTVAGCSSTSAATTVTVNTTPAVPTISASGATTFCSGNSITLTSSSATGNNWNTGANSQSITVSTGGSYAVTVTNSGCSASSAFTTVTVNTSPVISQGTITNPVACATNTGSILLNGAGTGNVSWSGTSSGVAPLVSLPYTISGLGAGSYSVNFTDGNGCVSNTLTPSLSDPGAPPAPTISSSGSTSICSGASVTLTSSSASGNTWSNGATTQSITVNASGNYSVTNTVAGCSSTSAVTIVTVNALPTVDAGTYSAVCQNALDVNLNAGSPAGGTYSGTGVLSFNKFDPSVGTQTLLYSYTDGNGCSNTSTTTINVLTPATINAGPDNSICLGSSVILTASGGVSYVWDQGIFDGVSFTPTFSDIYVVTGTDANGCQNEDDVFITVNTPPTVSAGSDQTVCFGTAVTLSGSGANTYSWNNGISDGVAFTPVGTAIYTVTGTDGNGCSNSDQVSVVVNPLPVVSAGADQVICSGASVTLQGSGAQTYTWDNGVSNGVSFTPSSSKIYTVTGFDNNGCSSTDQVSVTLIALPTINGNPSNPSVCGASDGSIVVSGTGTGNLIWNGNSSGSAMGVTLPFNITGLSAGTYSIQFTNATGCQSTALSMTLSDPGATAPSITANGPLTFCAGGSVTLTSSVTSGVTWTGGSTAGSITVTTSGTYTVTLNQGGCTSVSSPVTVTVNPTPSISSGAINSPASCGTTTGSVVINGSGNTGTISWTGAASGSQSGVSLPFTINGLGAGNYSVTFNNGCSSNTLAVSINDPGAPPTPTISASGALSFCNGGSVDLTSSATTGNTWSTNQTTQTITITASGTYSVAVSVAGCTSNSAPVTVTVLSNPTINAGADQVICAGQSVTLSATSADAITWDNGVVDNTPFTPSTTTTYTATATNTDGCTATDQVLVTVNALPVIAVDPVPTVCVTDAPVSLTATPAGGTFSGTGVSGSTFDPTGLVAGTYTLVYDVTVNGCSSTSNFDVVLDSCLAVNTISAVEFNIYPNPAGSHIQVQGKHLNQFKQFSILDQTGRIVLKGNIQADSLLNINLEKLMNGVYYIRLEGAENTVTQRFERMQ